MSSGSYGTQMNVVQHMPKLTKIKCNCKQCMRFHKNVCEFGRKLYPNKCKWFATLNDYNTNGIEVAEIKTKNNISPNEHKEKSAYNKGFGKLSVEKVDLSKYKNLKW